MRKKIVIESCSECPFLIHKEYSDFYQSYYCKNSSRNVLNILLVNQINYCSHLKKI